MGALDIWALPTKRTIWARAVSDPTRVALSCSASQLVLSQTKLMMTKAWFQARMGKQALEELQLCFEAFYCLELPQFTADSTSLTWHQDACLRSLNAPG